MCVDLKKARREFSLADRSRRSSRPTFHLRPFPSVSRRAEVPRVARQTSGSLAVSLSCPLQIPEEALSFLCLFVSLSGRPCAARALLRLVQASTGGPFWLHSHLCTWVQGKADLSAFPQLHGCCVSVLTFL